MGETIIGVNLPSNISNYECIGQCLADLAADGFDAVEINLEMLPLIIYGQVQKDYIAIFKRVLEKYPLRYTAHIGSVNLRTLKNFELHKQVLFASIDVCAMLGCNPLTLHFSQQSKDRWIEERFLKTHIEAADYAGQYGIKLCIENIEVETITPVVNFVRQVDRPNFGMTLDTGHAFLATQYFHLDFKEAIKECLPYISHLHLNDNMGSFEELRLTDLPAYKALPLGNRFTLGRGDIHLPPFWGGVPFRELFQSIPDYDGIYICEYYSMYFAPFQRVIQEKVRREIEICKGAK
jgi:sugar phosphate isomerase/epimerase